MTLTDLILNALADGPLSAADLAAGIDRPCKHVTVRLAQMKTMQLVHICKWVRDENKLHCLPYALYAEGPGRDAKRLPPLTHSEYMKRSRARKKKLAPSVFHLGDVHDMMRRGLR